jgi:hypothetical protein
MEQLSLHRKVVMRVSLLTLVFVVVVASLILVLGFMHWRVSRRLEVGRRRQPDVTQPSDQPAPGDQAGRGGPPRPA